MTKAEVAAKLANKIGLSSKQSVEAVEIFLECVKAALKQGDRVSLVGFGTFFVKEKDARSGRNPRTGKNIDIPDKRVAVFKPGRELRELVKNLTGCETAE
ncbi:TPA: integration host factor subunit alpha [Candidatus Sumerlaeota bacterium]|jgi:DNA-binding protein HU-beta|nr:integration host factor subunit alpha [Candidatus Sumerlaeota bacterium]